MKRFIKPLCMTCCCLVATGCTTMGDMFTVSEVKAWEKGTLAKPEMQLEGDKIDAYVDEHIYYSKEGSTGGTSVGGGGCGCN